MDMSKPTTTSLTIFAGIMLVAVAILTGYLIINSNESGGSVSGGDGQKSFWPFARQPAVVVDDKHQMFAHPRYGFSVVVPKDLEVVRVDEGQGTETVIFTPTDEGAEAVMQIFVTPYLLQEITKERLAKDVPSGEIKDVTEVMIGPRNDIRAVRFISAHTGLGEAREVWFLRNGYLFEVTTRMENDAWLATVLKTWQFAE